MAQRSCLWLKHSSAFRSHQKQAEFFLPYHGWWSRERFIGLPETIAFLELGCVSHWNRPAIFRPCCRWAGYWRSRSEVWSHHTSAKSLVASLQKLDLAALSSWPTSILFSSTVSKISSGLGWHRLKDWLFRICPTNIEISSCLCWKIQISLWFALVSPDDWTRTSAGADGSWKFYLPL